MNFMWVWQGQYLTSEGSERVRLYLPRQHKIHIGLLLRANVECSFLQRHTDDGVFDDFPKISENSSKVVRRSHESRRTFFENFRR